MEKPTNLVKIWNCLSRAAQPAPIQFQSPPPSPRKASSGPLMKSMIPAEARRTHRNGTSFVSKEPTSPKVSCMGQVKGKKKKKEKKSESKSKSNTDTRYCLAPQDKECTATTCTFLSCVSKEVKKNPSRGLTKVSKVAPPKGGDDWIDTHDGFVDTSSRAPERVPSLGQMKRFSSGRGVPADFDLPLELLDDQSGDVKEGVGGGEEDQNFEEIIQHQNQVNLRKIRTTSPLQL